jgi:hypothetical protein
MIIPQGKQTQLPDSTMFSNLSEDTIVYMQIPEQSQITILYEHIWAYGDATFTIYNETGQYYDQIVFAYDETHTEKTISLEQAGTYKLVATGVNFCYSIEYAGPDSEYRCVLAAMPHKAAFRLRKNEMTSVYLPVSSKNFDIHMSTDYIIPARDATIRIYDETDALKDTVYLDSTDLVECYEQIRSFSREDDETVFWRIELEGHGGGQSRIVVWANQSNMNHPTEQCTLLTSEPLHYFTPVFQSRSVSVTYEKTDHTAMVGSSGYVVGEESYVDLYNAYIDDLDLKTSKHWVSWHWREKQGSIAMNDDEDPYHINWDGFDMGAFDERMQYFVLHDIQPIMCMQWDTTAFITENPAKWDQNEMEEFAEFCLAVAIHCVAPDLEEPPVNREPYHILGVMPLNEPNLIYNQYLNLSESADAYISLLKTVGKRFHDHPDPRINELKFVVPGISPHIYDTNELDHWITQLLQEAKEYVDVISWDQYQYYLLEDLDSYSQDIQRIRSIMDDVGVHRPISLSEFGIHGGIPTIQEFYGSTFAKLYVFGSLAENINNDMTYPVYFTLIDPNNEPRQKGLFTGITSYPPFSYLPPLSPKPQYYAMQIAGWICQGNILEVQYTRSQLDILASTQEETIRMGISNRYESTTTVSIPLSEGTPVTIYNVTNTGLTLKEELISNGMVTLSLPAWTLYYIETNAEPTTPQSDLTCEGILSWNNIKPGSLVNGSFTIENTGDEGTILNWEITEYPSWGSWEFIPDNNGVLNPGQESIQINIRSIAPTEKNKKYTDYVKVINTDNPKDFELVPISLSTPRSIINQLVDILQLRLTERLKLIIERYF